jgi:hypothetical protein
MAIADKETVEKLQVGANVLVRKEPQAICVMEAMYNH